MRHTARHARTSDLRPRRRTSLSIRSAERRRWAADLTGPGSGGLVVYGMGGVGKSTLAAQIAARVGRLQSGRVVSVISGEVSAAEFAAGHPLAMEYLDLVLARGERYPDIAARIEAAIRTRTDLPEATAERIADAAGDLLCGELFDRLGASARSLLVRASVFRGPVTAGALAARPGPIAECEAAGLLTIGSAPKTHELAVHRWTAGQLDRRLAEAGLAAQVAAAHRQAAGHWLSRPGPRAELEAAYHQGRAAALSEPAPARPRRTRTLLVGGLAALAVALSIEAGHVLSVPAPADIPSGILSRPAPSVTAATLAREQAAAWLAGQVSAGAILGCDPAMCAALAHRGVPAGSLLALGPGSGDPLGSTLVVATASVRGLFGDRLASVYAPEVLASFGTGVARIDVRIVAPDGAPAYRTALAADVAARQAAGLQLLRDPRITVTPPARAALAAGQVDVRLLITLAALAAGQPLQVAGFGGRDPGASPGLPLRTAALTAPAATARGMLAFVRAQRPPYLAAHADITTAAAGQSVLTMEFAAPAPLGLLPGSRP